MVFKMEIDTEINIDVNKWYVCANMYKYICVYICTLMCVYMCTFIHRYLNVSIKYFNNKHTRTHTHLSSVHLKGLGAAPPQLQRVY